MKRTLFQIIPILALLWLAASCDGVANDPPPNILVIIADDLGFSDLGCYGGEIATPNLDRLAAGGLRYTQFYNTARCWPTRSALVTGFYPQQIRRDELPGAPAGFGGRGKRPSWARTVAELLRPAGYRTYHSGKWHIDGQPKQNGFDRTDPGSRGRGFFEPVGKKNRDPKFYRTIATANHAIECLKEHHADFPNRPFFQYVAFHAPHFPLHALPEDIARYQGRYREGWDKLRQQRHQRQRKLGMELAALSPLEKEVGPPYAFPEQLQVLGKGEVVRPLPWSELTDEQQRFQSTKMAIHAAMIDRMDREIGRILAQLRSMDAMNNTWICFLSDNGASAELMVRGDGHDPRAAPGSAASYLCLGPGFSSAANTPFRRHKTWVHEGGISTPMIVHWPAGFAAKNEFRSAVGHVIDIAPTLLDLAQIEFKTGEGAPPMSGVSLKPTFSRSEAVVHDELWFYHEGNRALRAGDWKIVHSNDRRPFPWKSQKKLLPVQWQLYNLKADRAEQNDLSKQNPDRTARMAERWTQLAGEFLAQAMGRAPRPDDR